MIHFSHLVLCCGWFGSVSRYHKINYNWTFHVLYVSHSWGLNSPTEETVIRVGSCPGCIMSGRSTTLSGNPSATLTWIHAPLRMNRSNSDDSITFNPASPSGQRVICPVYGRIHSHQPQLNFVFITNDK